MEHGFEQLMEYEGKNQSIWPWLLKLCFEVCRSQDIGPGEEEM